MIRSLHHVAIVCDDLERMLDFYCGVMGFERVASMSWDQGTEVVDQIIGTDNSAAEIAILKAGNAFLELFQFTAPEGKPNDPKNSSADRGVRHAAFDVSDIDAEYERLVAAGIVFNCPPVLIEVEGRPLKAAYFRDPEGNIMEIQELLDESSPLKLPDVR
ncbi:unannotated protein [freshwater metagenome]|uniref:Unannotated protein n=1 Tax=freshwater metagenome TaxID=449393 RepID=A0A6J7EIC5_9ZZZZ|nr:VOC family protein [Actinomycetota bacterium]